MNSLPKSFQDAVTVTRKLYIHSLWIDSLCIIQDSHEDWERESSRMASICQHAHVTVAATAAANSQEGFLYPHIPALRVRYFHAFRISYGDSNESISFFSIAYVRLNTSEEVSIKYASLNQSAWVLQEDWLSQRTLHFAKGQRFGSTKAVSIVPPSIVSYYPRRSPVQIWCTWNPCAPLINWVTILVQYVNIYQLINWAAIGKWRMTYSQYY
jgi:hypothetical protein